MPLNCCFLFTNLQYPQFTITNEKTARASWSTDLFAFFLLTVFADQLAAFSGNNCHVRGRIFHRDDGFGLQQTNKGSAWIQRQKKKQFILSLSALLTCLVKTIRPSRKGGTRLWTNRWTLAALSSSKSSSTSNLCTTPLVSMRLVSHRSLSWRQKHTGRPKGTEIQQQYVCSHDKNTQKLHTDGRYISLAH